MKKKDSPEEIIFTAIIFLSLWIYFKTSDLSTTLSVGVGLTILYILILVIRSILHKRKTLMSGMIRLIR
ncbi:Uncharacterised protein [Lederbergia lenta]|uniref:Uncharacterized protein n=1 Tax=Lederbergia lenta TaxID=1467 RepID=A0A2X4WGK1_LEDLE|nr:Uncharacterised protein [Lederbergia lenta]